MVTMVQQTITSRNNAKTAAFLALAGTLALMAFVTMPNAEATLYKKVLKVKILNNIGNVHHFKIKIKDIANDNKIVYVKDVNIASGNSIVVNAPITITGNSVNACVQALNFQAGLINIVAQKCKTISYGDADVKTVSFAFSD
jgi:uracil phosphoribosyltransferase